MAVRPLEVTVFERTPDAERVAGWDAEEEVTGVVWRRGVAVRAAAEVDGDSELLTAEVERVGTEVVVREGAELERVALELERVGLETDEELEVEGRLTLELERVWLEEE